MNGYFCAVSCTLMVLLSSTSSWATGETKGEKRNVEETVVETEGGTGVFRSEVVEKDGHDVGAKQGKSLNPSIRIKAGQEPAHAFISKIRKTYAALSKYAKAGGHDLRFELSGFENLTADQFDEIYYVDTSTLPGELMLTLKRSTFTNQVDGVVTVEYIPLWEFVETDWNGFPEGRRMLGMTLQEVLHEVSANDSSWLGTQAVTRFDVAASFNGKVRTYRSAFFWLTGESEGEWQARPLDHITQGVDLVMIETIPPEGMAIPPSSTEFGAVTEKITQNNCKSKSSVETIKRPTYIGTNGHFTGAHTSFVDFNFHCSCNTECTNRCSAYTSSEWCGETSTAWVWDACHKMNSARDGSVVGGHYPMGPECSAGFQCAQKACAFCFCSLSPSVEAQGISVEFGTPTADWTSSDEGKWRCPPCEENVPSTPIIVNFHGGFKLTGLDDAVLFDINGDGEKDSISWTDGAGEDAFLVLDRNGNGEIDDGRELFGSVTPQPESPEPNGYAALGVYDLSVDGGNGDGLINDEDQIFGDLRLWRDANHDGVSQPEELLTLSSAGVEAFELDHVISQRRDNHGNLFRWTSKVHSAKGKMLHAADVILLMQ